MALCRDGEYLKESKHEEFHTDHKPGEINANSGIYRCINCGDEVASNKGYPFPPQNHHQHKTGQPIVWRLLVFAQQKG